MILETWPWAATREAPASAVRMLLRAILDVMSAMKVGGTKRE